jgi:hypothetical protein
LTTVDSGLISSGAITVKTQLTGTLPEANGGTGTTTGYYGFKNRIINGAMVIDQRNAGASKTLTASTVTYTVDRFGIYCTTGTGHTYQQVTDAPAGFVNSFKFTVGTGGTPSSGQQNVGPYQAIEGYNTTDFNWGTASATAVTLSFWVKSSLTGTFCVSVQSYNGSSSYTYVTTYSVASANTWQYTTITIPANTYNTPVNSNSGGVYVFFGLGSGSTYTTAANTWTLGDFKFATGSVNVLGTSGATFYITGVQLEKGSTATSFDYRPYGTEFALCQRYYEIGTLYYEGYADLALGTAVGGSCGSFKVTKRTIPTMSFGAFSSGFHSAIGATRNIYVDCVQRYCTVITVTGECLGFEPWTATAEL